MTSKKTSTPRCAARREFRAAIAVAVAVASLLVCASRAEDRETPGAVKQTAQVAVAKSSSAGPDTPGILIDGIHANDLSTVGLGPEVYEYHQTVGFRRSIEYLRARGVACDRVTEGRLDAKRLSGHRLLFLNLVSAERPPFLVPEIAAIKAFVSEGGSLLAVTDHTNAYFHAYHLQPLLAELDIETFTCTACDQPPRTLGSGNGWITLTRFTPHPVTSGLECLGVQSGGCVDPRFSVAWTSEASWADAWSPSPFGEKNAPGFSGNFQRDPGEPGGPLGMVMAKSLGRGRIVVIGDQNMLGESFLHYADNYRLWLNAVAWLLDRSPLRDATAYLRWRSPRILLYEQYDRPVFGVADNAGCYHAFALLSRHYWTFANDRIAEPCDLMVFAYNDCELPAKAAAAAAAHLRRGRNVLVLNADRETLWEESGVVGRVLQAMGAARPKPIVREGKWILPLPGAGAIHVLGPDKLLDNWTLPSPTRPPEAAEKQVVRSLLDAVRDALDTKPARPAVRHPSTDRYNTGNARIL
jgi:hypothetical protein